MSAIESSAIKNGKSKTNRIFFGWYIVAAGMLIQAFGYGARYSFSVFFPTLLSEFGWPRDMGASIELSKSAITVRKSSLNAIQAALSDYTDLLPTLAVLAALACGRSEFSGVARARIKESNRVSALREGLEKMGIAVQEEKDRLTVTGARPKGTTINSKNDHRIAMAFSILGLVAGGTVINDAECVSKTFPDFWEVVRSIGGEVKVNGEQSG